MFTNFQVLLTAKLISLESTVMPLSQWLPTEKKFTARNRGIIG